MQHSPVRCLVHEHSAHIDEDVESGGFPGFNVHRVLRLTRPSAVSPAFSLYILPSGSQLSVHFHASRCSPYLSIGDFYLMK